MPRWEEGWWERLATSGVKVCCWGEIEVRRFKLASPWLKSPLLYCSGLRMPDAVCQWLAVTHQPSLYANRTLWHAWNAAVLPWVHGWVRGQLLGTFTKTAAWLCCGLGALWQEAQASSCWIPSQEGCRSVSRFWMVCKAERLLSARFQENKMFSDFQILFTGETGLSCSAHELWVCSTALHLVRYTDVFALHSCSGTSVSPLVRTEDLSFASLLPACARGIFFAVCRSFRHVEGEEHIDVIYGPRLSRRTCPFLRKNLFCSTAAFIFYIKSEWFGSTSVT